MSCVCILTPVVIAAWPAFSAAVTAAAASLGYTLASERMANGSAQDERKPVRVDLPGSEIVTDQLGRDQRISVSREGVTVTFSRDERGRACLCVEGNGQDETTLRAWGEELGQRVVQQYVYQRLMDEMRAREFVVVEQEVDARHAIRLKVRHWS